MALEKRTMPRTKQRGRCNARNCGCIEKMPAVWWSSPITETLEKNYMPYAMSVIVSRAIPEIDGFKPSHRKLLYTMYKMGLLTGRADQVCQCGGQHHAAESPRRSRPSMTRWCACPGATRALLHALCGFARATSARPIPGIWPMRPPVIPRPSWRISARNCSRDIDKDTVDFVDNYDATIKEPTLLPVTFPTILVNTNTLGIAVGMASSTSAPSICAEVCETTIALLQDPRP